MVAKPSTNSKKRPKQSPMEEARRFDDYVKEVTGISWADWVKVAERIDARRETEAREGQP